MKQSRLLIAAPRSGSGKTIITCGLLQLLKEQGRDVVSYKCGPDYIDPMFHRTVIGVPGGNLDTFFSSGEEIRSIVGSSGHDTAVIEGVMGIYDGITGAPGQGSCYDVSIVTDTPVLLVINVKGMGLTMKSIIRGILADDSRCMIRGIVLNRISERYFREMAPVIRKLLEEISAARGTDVKLMGGIPDSPDIRLESRHLGLMMPDEIADLREQIAASAALISSHIDMDLVLAMMDEAGVLECSAEAPSALAPEPELTLAVARDEAFCFYYEENIRILRQSGIRIAEFSPLHDSCIPQDADGLLLGGGYPELYAEMLSSNTSMMESIRSAIQSGLPSLAECGGFMTLTDSVEDSNGRSWPMAGVISAASFNTGKLSRFGYITVSGRDGHESVLSGLSVRGHEFHYYDSSASGEDAEAVKPGNGRRWNCIHAGRDHIWGYPHLYYPSCPELITRFREAMKEFRDKRK